MYDEKLGKSYFLNSTQIGEIMSQLDKLKFKRVYFHNKNINNLVIELDSGIVVIKNYSAIKNRPYVINIKKKVNLYLTKFALNKVIKKHSGKLVIATVSSIALLGGIHLIKGIEFSPIAEAPQIKSEELETFIDNATAITSITTPTETAISEEEEFANERFEHYCEIFEVYDDEKEQLYLEYINQIIKTDNIEQAVIDLMYSYYFSKLYMQRPIYYNPYTEEEQEATILKYAKIKGIEDEEILATMLAVHKLETGHGTSDVCYYKNNLGGNKCVNPYTGELEEHQTYPNVEVGAIDFVNDFVRIMNQTYDPNLPIEEYMNPVYCETESWYKTVKEIKDDIKSSNHLEEIESVLAEMQKNTKEKSY